MARNKNSTALFDVIHAAKKPPRSSPSASIPAPRWWGKDKKIPKPVAADPTENVGRQQSWLTAAKRNGGVVPSVVAVVTESQPVAESAVSPEPVQTIEPQFDRVEPETTVEAQPPAPKTRFLDRFKSRATEPAPAFEETSVLVDTVEPVELPLPVFYSEIETEKPRPQPRPSRVREPRESMLAIDSATRDVRFHLSYGGIVAIVFILLMALAIAFIAGTHTNSTSAMEDSSDAKPASAHYANMPATSGMMIGIAPAKAADDEHPVKPDVLSVSPKLPKPTLETPSSPVASLPIKASRDIGMIYVVIQSYPDQELAQKACDFVNRAGIPCTLVQGLADFALRDWYSVVGLQPFKKHDPGLEEYEKTVAAMGLKFSNKLYNQFQPQGYTWRADSDRQMQP